MNEADATAGSPSSIHGSALFTRRSWQFSGIPTRPGYVRGKVNASPVEEQILSETGKESAHAPTERGAFARLRAHLAQISFLTQIGLALIVAGVTVDLLAAANGAGHPSHHAASGHVGHLVAMAGMSTTLAGVVIDGMRRGFRPRLAQPQPKENSDAIR